VYLTLFVNYFSTLIKVLNFYKQMRHILLSFLLAISFFYNANAQFEYRGDVFYSYDEDLTIYIEASYSSRKLEDKGAYVYNLLKVYEDTESGSVEIISKELGDNNNIYPFTIADNYAKNTKKFIIIKGMSTFWVFDIRNKLLKGPFKPHFWGIGADSQSGTINDIKISEDGNYIYGITVDNGGFLYDICETDNIVEKLSANLPFLSEARFYELQNCSDNNYRGVYIASAENLAYMVVLMKDKKLKSINNTKILSYTDDDFEEVVMNISMTESRYVISEEIIDNKVNFIVIDIFTGNVINLPAETTFESKESIIKYLEK